MGIFMELVCSSKIFHFQQIMILKIKNQLKNPFGIIINLTEMQLLQYIYIYI